MAYVNGSQSWIRGDQCYAQVYAHELGHNVGFAHAASDGGGEYADHSSFMGNPGKTMQASAPNRAQMGWGNLIDVTSGTYTIDTLSSPSSAPQILRIRKVDTSEYYYVSFRTPVGNDVYLNAAYQRVQIHRYRGSGYSLTYLHTNLDADPLSSYLDTFSDSINGVSVRVLSTTATTATIEVSLVCGRRAPSLSISPSLGVTGPSVGAVSFTVSVTNNDQNCEPSTFALSSQNLSIGSGEFLSPSITIGSGASGATTFRVSATTSATATNLFSLIASDTAHANGSASATYAHDVNPPSTPAGLSAALGKAGKINLQWSAATDVGPSAALTYRVLRNGARVGSTTSLSYADSPGSGTFVYQLEAVDLAGNVSSASVSVTTSKSGGGKGKP